MAGWYRIWNIILQTWKYKSVLSVSSGGSDDFDSNPNSWQKALLKSSILNGTFRYVSIHTCIDVIKSTLSVWINGHLKLSQICRYIILHNLRNVNVCNVDPVNVALIFPAPEKFRICYINIHDDKSPEISKLFNKRFNWWPTSTVIFS